MVCLPYSAPAQSGFEQLTSMIPVGRMGRPEELVAAVRYLCSDDARFVTGSMLVLDGGYTAQ